MNKQNTDEKKQVKLGLLFMILLLVYMYFFSLFISPLIYKIYPSTTGINMISKGILLLFVVGLIVYTRRKWKWTADDWGFSCKGKFTLIVIFSTLIFWAYFWYSEGFPLNFGVETIKQFFTGASEELVFTVFFFVVLRKFFQTYFSMKELKSKVLTIFSTAIFFSLLHLPSEIWTFQEGIFNTLSFIAYRFLYTFSGTFFFSLITHGVTSNSQYMGLPIAIVFYFGISFLMFRKKFN